MQFFFNRDGKEEEIKPEIWRWEAHYQDGTVLKQFDDSGRFHQFSEIDQDKLTAFKMVSETSPNSFVLPFSSETMKLVHFYRNYGLRIGSPDFKKIKVYVFGYESKITHTKHLLAITPDGEVVLLEDIDILEVS